MSVLKFVRVCMEITSPFFVYFPASKVYYNIVMHSLLCPNKINTTPLAGHENYSTEKKTKGGCYCHVKTIEG